MTLTNVFRRKCTIYTKSTSFDEKNKINLYLCKVFAVVVMEQEKDLQQEYERTLLMQLFDFQPILRQQEDLVRVFAEFLYPTHSSLKLLHEQTLTDLQHRVIEVAEKWRKVIQATPVESLRQEAFLERVKRSAAYFEHTLKELLAEPLERSAQVETTDEQAKKQLDDALQEMQQTWRSRCRLLQKIAQQGLTNYLREQRKMENATTATHNEVGVWGEEQAAHYLQQKGYTIIEHDWKSGHKDIDLIALDGETVVFVEVKTRRNRIFGEPEDAVNYAKMKNLRAAFNHYIKYKCIDKNTRFDIVSVIGTPDGGLTDITHYEDVPIY